MAGKDPRQMKTAEVAKMARKKGVQDIEHMNKSQMIEAMSQQSGGRQQARSGGSTQRASRK